MPIITTVVVPNTYTCAWCRKEFKTDKDLKIRARLYEPLCSQNCYEKALFNVLFNIFNYDKNLEFIAKKWDFGRYKCEFYTKNGEFDKKRVIIALRDSLKYKNYVLYRVDIRQDKETLDIKLSIKDGQKVWTLPPLGGYVHLSTGPNLGQSNLFNFVPTFQFEDKKEEAKI